MTSQKKMSDNQVLELLNKYNIPYQNWGKGTSKPLSKFFQEIKSGEATLTEHNNQLIRVVSLAVINVFYKRNQKTFKLFESHQIYKNGRVVKRNLPDSIYEKLKPKETPLEGARRALKEELLITDNMDLIEKGSKKNLQMGMSFPGLLNNDTQYLYDVILSDELFKPEGYTEIQPDKSSYFIWQETRLF